MTIVDNPTSNENSEDLEQVTPKRGSTPLPIFPLLIVFLIQLSETVTATVIYPFINKLIRDLGITNGDERQIGYYAGFIESLFFIAEAATVYQWGVASDRFGRKPILLLGPVGLTLAMLGFGLSNKFWMLIFSRSLQGIFNGNIGVSKTVIAEITDTTNAADAYALTSVTWSVGVSLGPTIGGIFSEPALRWPDLFGRIWFFTQYPYLLPCAVAALVPFVSALFGLFGLKETAPVKVCRAQGQQSTDDSAAFLSADQDTTRYGTVDVTPTRRVPKRSSTMVVILALVGFHSFCSMAMIVLRPLVWSTSIPLGGLGFEPYGIGVILGIYGFLNVVFQAFITGPLTRRMGPKGMLSFAFIGYTVTFLLYSISALYVRHTGRVDAVAWIIIVIQLSLSAVNFTAFSSLQLLVVEHTPREHLGAANGLAQAVGAGTKGLAPTIAASLFSISLQRRLMGGDFGFYFLTCVALIGLRLVSRLPSSTKNRTS